MFKININIVFLIFFFFLFFSSEFTQFNEVSLKNFKSESWSAGPIVVYIIKGVLFQSIFNHIHVLTDLTGSSDQSDAMRP